MNFDLTEEQLILQKWSSTTHDWKTFGGVLNSGS